MLADMSLVFGGAGPHKKLRGGVTNQSVVAAKREKAAADVVMAFLCIALVLNGSGTAGSVERQFIYALPFFEIAIVTLLKVKLPQAQIRTGLIGFGLFGTAIVASVFAAGSNSESPFDAYFWASPWLVYAFMPKPNLAHLKWLVWALGVAIFASFIFDVKSSAAFSFEASEGIVETAYAFPLGALCIAFIFWNAPRQVKYRYAALSFVFLLISLKRIAVGAVFISVASIIFLGITGRIKHRSERVVYFLMMVILCYTLAIHFLDIVEFVNNNFVKIYDKSPEEFMLGRANSSLLIQKWMDTYNSSITTLFGNGTGAYLANADAFWRRHTAPHLHNDYLRILYESGYFGLVCLFGAFTNLFQRNIVSLALGFYMCVLFVSDNTLAYVQSNYIIMLIIVASIPKNDSLNCALPNGKAQNA